MATYPQEQADYVAGLTDEDFINGGHRTNFIQSLLANLAFIDFGKLTADEIMAVANQVAIDAASAAAGSGTEATVADIRSGVSAHYLSIRNAYAAQAFVGLAFNAGSTVWDMATGINFKLVLTGDTALLANPTNQVAGKSGLLHVHQDTTGGRNITSYGSNFRLVGGTPVLPQSPSALAVFSYMVEAAGIITLQYAGSAT